MICTVVDEKLSAQSASKLKFSFRLIPRVETFPAVLAFAQTPLGKLTLLLAFGLGWFFYFPELKIVAPTVLILGLMAFIPEQRRLILGLVPVISAVVRGIGRPLVFLGLNLAMIVFGMVLFWCARRWPKSLFGRRPVLFLLSGFTGLILYGCHVSLFSSNYDLIWNLIGYSASYVWFIGYALMDRHANPGTEGPLEMACLNPLWGSTHTPFPKGAAYLRRIEARDTEQLAVVQLKGLKLLLWAIILSGVANLCSRFFHGFLHIPTFAEALEMSVARTPLAWHIRWESQILDFIEDILALAVLGHRIIACCRMAGFNALRNTYRPLSSTTVAEFYNRYYYYYKELLVDFFFYPAFNRYWKGHRKPRLVFANFAAVCFGNAFYHFTRDWWMIRDEGLRASLISFQVFFFYTVVLATAISISQLHKRTPGSTDFLRGQMLPSCCVVAFFCLLHIFGSSQRNYPLVEHVRYFASLFFIHF